MRIAFFDPIKWDYNLDTARTKPLGGTQSAVCHLTEALAKLGHDVTLLNRTTAPGRSYGVTCLNYLNDSTIEFSRYDAITVVNFASTPLARYIRSQAGDGTKLFLWSQHAPDQPEVKYLADAASHPAWDGFVLVSEWQAQGYRDVFGIKPERMKIIGNAISPVFENLFPWSDAIAAHKPWPPVLCYTSTPFRGLDVLLDAFPRIRRAIPGTILKVYSSMNVYQVTAENDPYQALYQLCRATEGVDYIGSLPQPALAQELKQATCLAYPNTFAEGFCIAALEAMAAGCLVITSDLGNLKATTAGFGHLMPIPSDKTLHAGMFTELAVRVLQDAHAAPTRHAARLEQQVRMVNQSGTWTVRAREWHDWLTTALSPGR